MSVRLDGYMSGALTSSNSVFDQSVHDRARSGEIGQRCGNVVFATMSILLNARPTLVEYVDQRSRQQEVGRKIHDYGACRDVL